MQRMKRKKRGNKSAFPDSSGHAVKKPEQQQSAQYMQDKVGQVITAGIQSVKLIIKHVGKP
jgi:hypothetical protein